MKRKTDQVVQGSHCEETHLGFLKYPRMVCVELYSTVTGLESSLPTSFTLAGQSLEGCVWSAV